MRISKNRPALVKRPVYVNATTYELWFSKPIMLGQIKNVDGYWFTSDGMRFVSSLDALDYCIRIYELGGSAAEVPPTPQQKTVTKSTDLDEIEKLPAPAPVAPKKEPAVPEAKKLPVRKIVGATAVGPDKTDTMYKKFLEFMRQSGEKSFNS